MKRIISLVLILILSLGVLTACPKPSTTSEYPLDQAAEYVRGLYTDFLDNNKTKSDYSLIASLMFSGSKYTVEWAVSVDSIKVVPSADGLEVTVDVPEQGAEAIEYTLTGTVIAPDGFTKDITFDLVVPALEVKPVLNLTGNENLVSASGEKNVFAANGITFTNDKASSTSALTVQESYAQRAYAGSTIKIEYNGMRKIVITCDDYEGNGKKYYTGMDGMEVEGALIIRTDAVITIYFPNGSVDVFQSTSLAGQIRIEQIEVFTTLTAEDNAIIANGGNSGNGGSSEHTAPAANTAFKLYMNIGGSIYYFKAGALDQDRWLLSTTELAESTDIFFEVVDGGYHIYFMDGTTSLAGNCVPELI